MPFNSPEGELENVFVRDYSFLTDLLETAYLWTWGYNLYGMLGDNTNTSRSAPVQTAAGGSSWVSSTTGKQHTLAIKTDGSLWAWGRNQYGQLGDSTVINKSSPTQVIPGSDTWVYVNAGDQHSLAIKTNGSLWAWGDNDLGQLGTNDTTARSSPAQVASGTTWKLVSAGGYHSAAIKNDGSLWAWGDGGSGQLGDDTGAGRSTPTQVAGGGTNWRTVACGSNHTLAIKTDETLWGWGDGNFGQLGNGVGGSEFSPIQIITTGIGWATVSAGIFHSAAISTDGTLWTWGYNAFGELGDNSTTTRYSPVQTVASENNWTIVSAGGSHTMAISKTKKIWGWGDNRYGQLGDSTITSRSSPIQLATGGNTWVFIDSGEYQSMAISIDT